VWRGALLLADYVLASAERLRSCVGLELGAGAGLAGLALAAAGARRVFLTDTGSAVLDQCKVTLRWLSRFSTRGSAETLRRSWYEHTVVQEASARLLCTRLWLTARVVWCGSAMWTQTSTSSRGL